jgi:hypothetical protein
MEEEERDWEREQTFRNHLERFQETRRRVEEEETPESPVNSESQTTLPGDDDEEEEEEESQGLQRRGSWTGVRRIFLKKGEGIVVSAREY